MFCKIWRVFFTIYILTAVCTGFDEIKEKYISNLKRVYDKNTYYKTCRILNDKETITS